MGQATREAIQSAVSFIVNKMKRMPFTAKVIKSKGNNIYINSGSLMNIKPGDRFNAFSKGEEFIDPDTGLSLGSEETFIGTIEIKDVKEKFSIAGLISGKDTLKRGDIIKGATGNKTYNISAAGVPDKDIRGMLVVGVNAGGAAEAAGIQPVIRRPGVKNNNPEDFKKLGDIITKIDGHSALGNLLSHLARKKPGERVSLKVIRDGQPRIIKATLEARPK